MSDPTLDERQRQILAAALARFEIVDAPLPTPEQAPHDPTESAPSLFAAGLTRLDDEACAVFGVSFTDLHDHQRDELLQRVRDGNVRSAWTVQPEAFFEALAAHAARKDDARA